MKRFEFPLESVLRLRRFAEAEARQALTEALTARNQAEAELLRTREQSARQMRQLTDELPTLAATEVVAIWQELDHLEELALKQAAHLADCEAEVQRRTEAYIEAQQERKPLERLKEEMHREYLHEQDLAEQAFNDELAVIGHSRKGGEA
ncbi:MAG: flagellar export protein FliJ [Armatimonadetes bacterium]|nr:flagellar export protein FliJ [Armatimonadota bacterium]